MFTVTKTKRSSSLIGIHGDSRYIMKSVTLILIGGCNEESIYSLKKQPPSGFL